MSRKPLESVTNRRTKGLDCRDFRRVRCGEPTPDIEGAQARQAGLFDCSQEHGTRLDRVHMRLRILALRSYVKRKTDCVQAVPTREFEQTERVCRWGAEFFG